MPVAICKSEDKVVTARVAKLYTYEGLKIEIVFDDNMNITFEDAA